MWCDLTKSKRNQILGIILLVITSLIWGGAFVAQNDAMNHIGPLTMNGIRTLLAAIFLFPVCMVSDVIQGKKPSMLGTNDKAHKKTILLGGLLCGIVITLASGIQQIGIKYTSVGKAGFLTTLYVVFVPIIELFLGKRIKWNGWIGVALAMLGMFFICIIETFTIELGDLLIILSAFFFAVHILIVDKYVGVAGMRLSPLQFLICGVCCLAGALIFEEITWNAILQAMPAILYAGIASAGIGYTLQIIAQKWVAPNIAPLVMCLESVFALLFGSILHHESMTAIEYIGCALVFIAIVVAQIDFSSIKSSKADNQSKED